MTDQIGFGFLAEIDKQLEHQRQADERRLEHAKYEHFPSTLAEGLEYYRDLIDRHHELMMCGDVEGTMKLRNAAHDLAYKLNGFEGGILAGDDAAGNVLQRETAAPIGTIPKWGQTGCFEIVVGKMRVRIEQHGVFGIGANFGYWPGFAARAVEMEKPFLSETGYRSFIGAGVTDNGQVATGLEPDGCASEVIFRFVSRDLKGRLVKIIPFEERMVPPKPVARPEP